jgi:hypothetical protein
MLFWVAQRLSPAISRNSFPFVIPKRGFARGSAFLDQDRIRMHNPKMEGAAGTLCRAIQLLHTGQNWA